VRQIVSRSAGPWALLLAALVMSAGPLRAAEAPIDAPDLRLVPADAAGFATVQVAGVAGKLGFKETRGVPLLAVWEKRFGVRAADLERFTLVFVTLSDDPVNVCRTSKPCDRQRVLKALAPDAQAVKRNGKVFHVNDNGAAVHFADDRTFLAGPEKLVTQVVEKRGPEDKTRLAAALRRAADHDLFVWSKALDPEERPAKVVTSYKAGPGGAKVPALAPGALALFGDLPAPAGIEAADASLDVGDRTVLRVRLDFAEEESAKRGAKLVRVATDGLRAMLLMGVAELSALDADEDLFGVTDAENAAEVAKAAPDLLPVLRAAERALQKVRVEAEGTTVPVTVTVPVGAKKLRAALAAGLALATMNNGDGPSPDGDALLPFLPSRRPPAPAPAACPGPSCPAVRPGFLSPTGTNAVPLPEPLPMPRAGQAPTMMPVLPASNWGPGIAAGPTPYQGSASPALVQTQDPRPVPPGPAAGPVKLTVANVTKEPALLFSEGENGKLVFSRKVPAGEAVDVETTAGKRWVAVFAERPAGEAHLAAGDKPWLLRPATRDEAKMPAAGVSNTRY
jgi:hypothetical protein